MEGGELKEMLSKKLIEEKIKLAIEIEKAASIDRQLSFRNEDGSRYGDESWVRRAKMARRNKSSTINTTNHNISAITEQLKPLNIAYAEKQKEMKEMKKREMAERQKDFERMFLEIAKDILDEDTFKKIKRAAAIASS